MRLGESYLAIAPHQSGLNTTVALIQNPGYSAYPYNLTDIYKATYNVGCP